MSTLESLRALAFAGDVDGLRSALSAAEGLQCSHAGEECPDAGNFTCSRTVEYIAEQAAQDGQLEAWCYIFDNFIRPQARSISWDSMRHITRRGDCAFADAFQVRQAGWANSIQPRGIRGEPQTMSIIKLAVMRGQMDFVDHLIQHCECDLNAGGLERSPVRMVIRMELEDDECMRRLNFLAERGARLDDTGAIEAAEMMKRPSEEIQYLQARLDAERKAASEDSVEDQRKAAQ